MVGGRFFGGPTEFQNTSLEFPDLKSKTLLTITIYCLFDQPTALSLNYS